MAGDLNNQANFLLGASQTLIEPVTIKKRPSDKNPPYTFEQSVSRLLPHVRDAATALRALPREACPFDMAVEAITIHPDYLAKSFFPDRLLRRLNLTPIGSRAVTVSPQKWSRKSPPKNAVTSEVFVAGERAALVQMANQMPKWSSQDPDLAEIIEIENLRAPTSEERVLSLRLQDDNPLLEIVLHTLNAGEQIYKSFLAYLEHLQIPRNLKPRSFYASGLCFLGLRVPRQQIPEMAKFSFLRVAREMPSLRTFRPGICRNFPSAPGLKCKVPTAAPVDASLRLAVFDGGLPRNHGLDKWVSLKEDSNLGASIADGEGHGLQVTSAGLFGPLAPGIEAPQPFCGIDHYRVFDVNTDPNTDLLDVLGRITDVLKQRKYEYISLSLGPDIPVDDNNPHVWTTVLDEILADGKMLMGVAVGNSGESDAALQLNRIQPPSDCVNTLSVGACDCGGEEWSRATYSSVGPGRSPGVIKPEVVAFGGTEKEPFFVLDSGSTGTLSPTAGTSFATPSVMRLAAGIRAHFGDVFTPLATKAILLNRSACDEQSPTEVGFGRVPDSLEDLVVCPEGVASVVYQGMLLPKQFVRVPIPWPRGTVDGKVEICATVCIASKIDPAHPVHYTRAGLEITFRPHREKFKINKQTGKASIHPAPATFFSSTEGLPETDLRTDEHKWETSRQATIRKFGTSLKDPVLDVHYIPRVGGKDDGTPDPIPYAVVITVSAPGSKTIYNDIIKRYPGLVVAVKPKVAIQIRNRA